MKKQNPKEDLGERIRDWYYSYIDCPPWSSFLGFMTRELTKAREEGKKKLRYNEILKEEIAEEITKEKMKLVKYKAQLLERVDGMEGVYTNLDNETEYIDGCNQALEDFKKIIKETI